MTLAASALLPRGGADKDALRWSLSLAGALVLHLVAAAVLLTRHEAPPALPAEPSITMIDLAPLPAPVPQPPAPPQPAAVAPVPDIPPPPVKPLERPKPVVHRVVAQPVPVPLPAPAPEAPSPPQIRAAPPPAPAATPNPALPNFRDLLAARLERYKRYPHDAQVRGEQGTVLLRFTLERNGTVANARIVQSSGHASLDDEVMALIRRAQPLPPIPPEIAADTLDLTVPVQFSLR